MGTIQLHDRTRLPPSQVAAVRPRELPAEEPEPTLEFAAELAGDIFDKAIKSRAGNEEAEFRGSVDTAIQDYETTLAENPGMTEEELDKLETATITKIDSFNKLATLPQSKQYIKDYNLKNRELLIAKLKTIKGNIVTRQETTRFNENVATAIRDMKPNELAKLYEDTDLFDPETNLAMFKNDMSKLEQRLVAEQRRQEAEARAEAGRARAEGARAAKEQKAAALSVFEGRLTDIALGISSPPPSPITKKEFNALPSGTEFIAPDGTRRRKP